MLIDNNTTYQYHARMFDGPMIYSPYILTIDYGDYGMTLDSFGVYRSGITGYTTKVVAIRNDNDVADTLGSFSSGSGWIWFKGRSLGKRYVVSRILLVSTSTGGYGNEIDTRGVWQHYTEQVYPHRHPPLGQMIGVNTYVWDFINSFTTVPDPDKVSVFNTLGSRSNRFYIDGSFYSQRNGATWSFNPIGLGYYEENLFGRLKTDNPNAVFWNVLQGQTPQVKQSWRDNPDDTYTINGTVASYTDNFSFGILSLNVTSVNGAGGGPANWRIENMTRPSAKKTYPEGTPVTIPFSLPAQVSFFVDPGLSADYLVGETVKARLVYTSQLNIMYNNISIASRNTLPAWDSLSRYITAYTDRRGRNTNAPPLLLEPGNTPGVGVNAAQWTEPMNESNASWAGFLDYVNGEGHAYAWSESYDYNKRPSTFFGVKNMDTSMKMSTSGLAINIVDLNRSAEVTSLKLRGTRPKDPQYTQPTFWKYNTRGQTDQPFDIIQFHNYSYTGGADQYFQGINGALPIEISPSLPAVKQFVWFRNKYAPWALVDVGEWGYDIHGSSPMGVPAIGSHSIEQVIGAWAVRTVFEYNVNGVDYAQHYRLYSYDSTGVQFSTMSWLRYNPNNGTFSRKLEGNYIAQLKALGDFVYDSTLRSDSVRVYRFKHDTSFLYYVVGVERWNNSGMVFYERPTFTERTGTYTLPLPEGTAVTVMNLQDTGTDMSTTSANAGAVGYTINYNLTPVFILTGGAPLLPSLPGSRMYKIPRHKKIIFTNTF
jgi:hypothetical protein